MILNGESDWVFGCVSVWPASEQPIDIKSRSSSQSRKRYFFAYFYQVYIWDWLLTKEPELKRCQDKRSCNCIHAALTSPKSGNIFNIFSFCPLIRLNGGGRARCICSGGGRAAQWRGAVDSTRWRGEKGGKGGEGSAGAQSEAHQHLKDKKCPMITSLLLHWC